MATGIQAKVSRMDGVKAELKKLKDKVYIEEMDRNLDFAKEFLAKVVEDPNLLDSVPDGALLVPYPIPIQKKEGEKAKDDVKAPNG